MKTHEKTTYSKYINTTKISACNLRSHINQDNVHMNTESVQCNSIVYSECPYKYNQ